MLNIRSLYRVVSDGVTVVVLIRYLRRAAFALSALGQAVSHTSTLLSDFRIENGYGSYARNVLLVSIGCGWNPVRRVCIGRRSQLCVPIADHFGLNGFVSTSSPQ